jgi:hypothetical protein
MMGAFQVAFANDSAAALAAGGIELIRQEQITMEKEDLFISPEKVTVSYEFRNTSDQDITTEVAFPIPEFGYQDKYSWHGRFINDFKVYVNGDLVPYETEIKAMVGDIDVAGILREYDIQPETFGGFCWEDKYGGGEYVVNGLALDQVRYLAKHGIINKNIYDLAPEWKVVIKYHWPQTFPAQQVVSIRHEYTPVLGLAFETPEQILERHQIACVEAASVEGIELLGDGYSPVRWVEYILTTANSWKGAIGDFTLRISPDTDTSGIPFRMIFCWDGPVEMNEKGEAVVHTEGFIPEKDLEIVFLTQYADDTR